MKDYRLEIKIKNNLLYKAMIENGFDTVASLSNASGVDKGIIYRYLSLKETPLSMAGEWKKSFLTLADFLKRLPEDLYPKQHLTEPLRKNTAHTDISFGEMQCLFAPSTNPHDVLLASEQKRIITKVLSCLTKREHDVVVYRFGLGDDAPKTLRDTGKVLKISTERTRQIENKAMRKLRHRHSKVLKDVMP